MMLKTDLLDLDFMLRAAQACPFAHKADLGLGLSLSLAGNEDAGDDSGDDDDNDDGLDDGVITQTDIKTKRPQLYKVLMLNDDYSPMEFVVHVLQRFFRMNMEEATQVMLHVHQKGVGVCGVFPYDVAETKVSQVMDLAQKHQHPLQCTLEKE